MLNTNDLWQQHESLGLNDADHLHIMVNRDQYQNWDPHENRDEYENTDCIDSEIFIPQMISRLYKPALSSFIPINKTSKLNIT